jgi:hypothetical protein
MINLHSLIFTACEERDGCFYDVPFDLLAASFSTSNLTCLRLTSLSAPSMSMIAKGLPSSSITTLKISYSDFEGLETLRVPDRLDTARCALP